MIRTDKSEIHLHGLRVFKPRHPSVRRIKRTHRPSVFGYRMWKSSWLLIDFIRCHGLPSGLNILEVGCGWGLAGIYCARSHQAQVTCLDADAEVFPFLDLHAETNQVAVSTLNMRLEDLSAAHLAGIDIIIGADVCFWDDMVPKWQRMIGCARQAGVRQILLADPGRPSFGNLAGSCLEDASVGWQIQNPFAFTGRVLKIGNLSEKLQ